MMHTLNIGSEREAEKANVLVIDDDEHISQMLTKLLSKEGYLMETAKNGAEAVEKSNAKTFDLALIDVVLPDMQGTQLLVKLKDTVPKMRKIIVTGYATLDNAVEAVNLGADAYIMKPVKPQELLKAIEEQLRKQQQETVMTSKKIVEFIETRKADFLKVVIQSMDSLWGRPATTAVIHHLGGEEALRDPNIFAERLKTIFSDGSEVILKQILKNLETPSESSQPLRK